MQQLLHVCEEGKVRDVDSVLEKWNKDNHNCNEANEVCSYMVTTTPHFADYIIHTDRMARQLSLWLQSWVVQVLWSHFWRQTSM